MAARLRAEIRQPGHARRVRREGGLPAVLYGPSGNYPIRLDAREFHRLWANGKAQRMVRVELVHDGQRREVNAMIKEMQWHPYRGQLLHVDLLEVREDEPVRTVVPIVLRGIEEAEKRGIVQHQLAEVEIECLPKDVPPAIEGDVAGLPVGEELRVRDLSVPAAVRVLEDPDQTVAVLLPPKELAAGDETSAAAEGGNEAGDGGAA